MDSENTYFCRECNSMILKIDKNEVNGEVKVWCSNCSFWNTFYF